ncbi:hypothetical protein [Chryseobacterium endalhagicum]|nr:hypothetical protein [Chryseobacterium endalhagicum]
MKKILTVFATFICLMMYAQNVEKIAKEVKEEGVELYRSEMASWYGTDVFRENYKNMDDVGGYFSYIDDKVPKCVFFSKNHKVIGTISFPANYNPKDAKTDFEEREFTPKEQDYFTIRQKALERVQNDTIFKVYKNTNLNLVPVIRNNLKKVYILTGTSASNTVIFGNDYLIHFNERNEIKNVEKLHQGMVVQKLHEENESTVGGAHTHILDNWQTITPTDVCTLMLYQRFTNWKNYTVVSKKYISIWDTGSENLMVMKSKDFEKMSETIKERNQVKNNK